MKPIPQPIPLGTRVYVNDKPGKVVGRTRGEPTPRYDVMCEEDRCVILVNIPEADLTVALTEEG